MNSEEVFFDPQNSFCFFKIPLDFFWIRSIMSMLRVTQRFNWTSGGIPEWPKGTDCKSAAYRFGGSNPPSPTSKKTWCSASGLFTTKFTLRASEILLCRMKLLRGEIRLTPSGQILYHFLRLQNISPNPWFDFTVAMPRFHLTKFFLFFQNTSWLFMNP